MLVTRVSGLKAERILKILPKLEYNANSQILFGNAAKIDTTKYRGTTLILSADTSDIPVTEEARFTLKALGYPEEHLYGVGVADLHLLLIHRKLIDDASTIIVVTGMEGRPKCCW